MTIMRWATTSAKTWLRGPRGLVTTISSRRTAELESAVLDQLRALQDGLGLGDLVSTGRVKDLQVDEARGRVQCKLEAHSPVLQDLAQTWKADATKRLSALPWIKQVDIEITSPKPRNPHAGRFSALARVANVIAVSSCKGGVGKSTVAVNLAFSLAQKGARVGILDADIYGPSLPTMVSPDDKALRYSIETRNLVVPLTYEGVKCMSFGFVNHKAAPGAGGIGPAIMRGPMVSKLVDQLILGTEWGELDYLVVDMPPGTGDIQLSLSQQLAISAAVIVTTPQKLSLVDVDKGIQMFNDMKVTTAAIVENMSYFDCIHGHRHYPFGQGEGHTKTLMEKYKLTHSFKLPISDRFSKWGDSGRPFVLAETSSEEATTYQALAVHVVQQLVRQQHAARLAPELLFDASRHRMVIRVFTSQSAHEVLVSPVALRAQCRCAQCVDEFTGTPRLDPASIPNDIRPTRVERKGNYAYGVVWSDGHAASLYTFDQLRQLAVHHDE